MNEEKITRENRNSAVSRIKKQNLPFLDLFYKVREVDIPISITDYRDLILSLDQGYGLTNKEEFYFLILTLWTKSREEQKLFEALFKQDVHNIWNELTDEKILEAVPLGNSYQPKSKHVSFSIVSAAFCAVCLSGLIFLFGMRMRQDGGSDSSVVARPPSGENKTIIEHSLKKRNLVQERETLVLLSLAGTSFIFLCALYSTHLLIERIYSRADITDLSQALSESTPLDENREDKLKVRISKSKKLSISFSGETAEDDLTSFKKIAALYSGKEASFSKQVKTRLYRASFYEDITLRQMRHIWRSIKVVMKEGYEPKVDVQETVRQAAKQGMFLEPIYQPSKSNQLEIAFLIDWGGSMFPFHDLAEDLLRTALSSGTYKRVKIGYFYNFPTSLIFSDNSFLEGQPVAEYLSHFNRNQSLMVVFSDAGSARGNSNPERVKFTKKFVEISHQKVSQILWLNPMPRKRWKNTSAEFIEKQKCLTMFSTTHADMREMVKVSQRAIKI